MSADIASVIIDRLREENAALRKENAALREAVAIEQERSLYWRKIAGRKEAQP